jgi:hypothetical protein
MVTTVVTVRVEALVRAEPVKPSRTPSWRANSSRSFSLTDPLSAILPNDLAFKNSLSSANIVEPSTCRRNGLDRNEIRD